MVKQYVRTLLLSNQNFKRFTARVCPRRMYTSTSLNIVEVRKKIPGRKLNQSGAVWTMRQPTINGHMTCTLPGRRH